MAVRLRLKRMGRTHQSFFRLNAIDGRSPRDGRVLEELGHYDPHQRDTAAQTTINTERVQYWLSVGAQPSPTVRDLLRKNGIQVAKK